MERISCFLGLYSLYLANLIVFHLLLNVCMNHYDFRFELMAVFPWEKMDKSSPGRTASRFHSGGNLLGPLSPVLKLKHCSHLHRKTVFFFFLFLLLFLTQEVYHLQMELLMTDRITESLQSFNSEKYVHVIE
jgi:hypothetical protein